MILYQRLVDISGKSNYIIILKNHKILYCVDGKVKLVPVMKMNVVDYSSFDSIFVGALTYALIRNVSLDDAIKFADTAASISLAKIGEVDSIPELMEVLENSGLKEKFGVEEVEQKQVVPESIEPIHSTEVENNIVSNTKQNETINENIAFTNDIPEKDANPQPDMQQQPQHETNIFDNYNV